MTDALVLSGGRLETERFAGLAPGVERKAQIPILGRPMVEWVVRALRATPAVGRVVVVGHPSLDTPGLRELEAAVVPERGEIAANLRAGMEALPGAARVLALSGDLPLLTAAALEDLLTHAPEADVVFPYVPREAVLREFPDREWIFAPTADGHVTGSSLALFRPEPVLRNWRWAEALLDARRLSPLRLAAMVGPLFALKLLFRRLHIRDVEERLSSLLHLTGRGYASPYPEVAMDVDKFTDIAFVEAILQRRQHTEGVIRR